MKYLSRFLLLYTFLLFVSCNQDDESPNGNETEPVGVTEPEGYQQYGVPFNDIPANEDIVMYEVNLRAFSNGGDLQGVINKLDHIESLGVNVIWLMPIYPQGQLRSVGSPYSVRDYKAVSTEYGDLEDLRRLTTLAHQREIAVILDWVANHTSWDNEWIRNNSDWYTKDANGIIIHPAGTNWQDVADLNYENEDMRDAMIDAMKYWIYEANIDGFRCDYADGVPADFWSQAWQEVRSIPNRDLILFAEGDRSDHFDAGFDLSFGWDFYSGLKNVYSGQPASNLIQVATIEYTSVPTGKEVVRFTTNHDESAWDATTVSIFGGIDGALSAQAVTVFMGGVPLIYGSQEVGQLSTVPFFSNSSIDWNQNPTMLESYKKMMTFYSNSPTARKGTNTVYNDIDVIMFKKSLNGDEVILIANTRNSSRTITIPAALDNTTWTDIMTNTSITFNGQLVLRPFEFYILD
ncbi:glycosidase [Nonlabens dokdonensis]|uniref:Alpha amylase, catalytic region n=2 Tax=Nonlabens dokdonensis TaxID=328515 RepID=L7W8P9_NONDD|nr:alpha-amylase family glycosyl hydrolase [Nonlabens dokdonensis]AGC76529.1 alpha amylase, catalytic region [Nonlabens dokdonensis DSW-6]PZX44180.1 glycosidase [Nonlabens dokdonensis]